MFKRLIIAAVAASTAAPAFADGPVLITHDTALTGDVTPGDAPGYPVTIKRAGSYQLASNLRPGTDKVAIEIAAANVTVDLNGFALLGKGVASQGISYTNLSRNVTIRNGIVSGFKLDGIVGGYAWTVENMQVVQNGGKGVWLYNYGRVANSIITQNGGAGVDCGWACHVQGNIVSQNGSDGVAFFYGGTVLGNTIAGNGAYGIRGSSQSGYVTGFGNNTVDGNTSGSRTGDVRPLHPNACDPACP
jgi:hypothetical protein